MSTFTRPTQLRLPARDSVDESLSDALHKTAADPAGRPLPIFAVLAHHEQLLRRFNSFGALLRNSRVTAPRDREVIILRVAWRNDCVFEFEQHVALARAAGLDGQVIAAIRDCAPPPEDPVAALLIKLADEVVDQDSVTDPTWSAAASRWGHDQLLELVMTAGFFRMAAVVINAVGLRPSAGWPRC